MAQIRTVIAQVPRRPKRHDTTGAWRHDDGYFCLTGGSDSSSHCVIGFHLYRCGLRAIRRGFCSPHTKHQIYRTSPWPHLLVSQLDRHPADSDRFFRFGTHSEYQLIRMISLTTAYDVILPDAGATDVDATS